MIDNSPVKSHSIMDKFFELLGEGPLPLLSQLLLAVHLFFCPRCSREAEQWEALRQVMKTDFFPPSPGLEDAVMAQIYAEAEYSTTFPAEDGEYLDAPAGVSFKWWVITGCIILISLSSAFFGMDFVKIADAQGSSFLLPIGLTIGFALTCYGALFIGSHLKGLSAWFRRL